MANCPVLDECCIAHLLGPVPMQMVQSSSLRQAVEALSPSSSQILFSK